MSYYGSDIGRINYPSIVDKKDDDDDDNDDKRKLYKQPEVQKEDLIKKGYLDKSACEKFNKFFRATEDMKNKEYILGKDNFLYKKDFKNNYYLNLFNEYLNDNNKYNNIVKEKKQIDDGIKIYEKNEKNYKTVTEEEIINSKKVSKNLDELIDLINKHTIREGDDFIREPGSTDLSWMDDSALY